jgi:hypothetical protein
VEISNNQFTDMNFDTKKFESKKVQRSYCSTDTEVPKDEEGNILPYDIEFTDFDKKICYNLNYDNDKQMYVYHDRTEDMINNEEIDELFKDDNDVRKNTLDNIPSGFKEILLASINPQYYYVSIQNRQFRVFSFENNLKRQVSLNNDYLVESINQKFEYYGSMYITFSYDYVQDHFTSIENPLETYKDKIIFENDM